MVFDQKICQSLFEALSRDERISVWHISIILAVMLQVSRDNIYLPICTSRKKIMALARIGSIATYHKYIKELVQYGYIEYTPSYHPAFGSAISILQTPIL